VGRGGSGAGEVEAGDEGVGEGLVGGDAAGGVECEHAADEVLELRVRLLRLLPFPTS
jgi:hypothetical protein